MTRHCAQQMLCLTRNMKGKSFQWNFSLLNMLFLFDYSLEALFGFPSSSFPSLHKCFSFLVKTNHIFVAPRVESTFKSTYSVAMFVKFLRVKSTAQNNVQSSSHSNIRSEICCERFSIVKQAKGRSRVEILSFGRISEFASVSTITNPLM